MSQHGEPLEPLSPELDALVRAERDEPAPEAAVESAVFARLGATLGPIGGLAPSAAAAVPASLPAVTRILTAHPLLATALTFAIGTSTGLAIHGTLDRRASVRGEGPAAHSPVPSPAAPPAGVARAVPPSVLAVPLPVPPSAKPSESTGMPSEDAAPSTRARTAGPSSSATRSDDRPQPGRGTPDADKVRDRALAMERTLIEQAHTALSRGRGGAAVELLERHTRLFPDGQLIEERESLMIQALVDVGRYDDARRLGTMFHRHFPNSIFGEGVDESLGSIPASRP